MAVSSTPKIPNCATETTIIKTNLDTGEIIYETTFRGSRSGSGWIMMFTDMGMEIVAKCPSATTLRIYMYLAMGQTFDGGMKTTKRAVEQYLGLSHRSVALAFDWLKKNFIVHEWRHNGVTEFMVNPRYVSVGKFDERIKLWNARWEMKPFFASAQYQRKKSEEYFNKIQSVNS